MILLYSRLFVKTKKAGKHNSAISASACCKAGSSSNLGSTPFRRPFADLGGGGGREDAKSDYQRSYLRSNNVKLIRRRVTPCHNKVWGAPTHRVWGPICGRLSIWCRIYSGGVVFVMDNVDGKSPSLLVFSLVREA